MSNHNPCRRPARVMLFTDSFDFGGTERQVVETLRLLKGGRYNLYVGCLKRRGAFLADVENMGIPVREFPISSLHSIDAIYWFFRLARFLRREHIDIVHAFEFYTSLFAVAAARLSGVPVVIASRRDMLNLRSVPRQWAIRLGCWLAHSIVANSRAAANRLFWGSERKVVVIPNSLNAAAFHPRRTRAEVRLELGLSQENQVFGVVAALRPEKGHDVLLQASATVFSSLPLSKLVIVGDGSERSSLEMLAAALKIEDRIVFAGARSDIPDLVSAFDIAVIPSYTESLPNAALEAMALGRAIVATRTGGIPELVEEGKTGYLVQTGNAEQLAARIIDLLHNPALCQHMGKLGSQRIEQSYSPERVKASFEALYDSLLCKNRRK
jgi:glycosyltransferase involved in cell wall biosynthesis